MRTKKIESRKDSMTRCKDGRLLRPFLDWSFKYLFGTPENKPNLIAFLNLMLMPESPIVDVEFMNNESLPDSPEMKECVFDIICINKNGEQYLIEVQNRQVENMRERIIYYTCRLVDRMGRRGSKWDYQDIKKVYSICIMNFNYEKEPVLRRDIQLCDMKARKVFSDKLNIILIQMPCMKGMKIGECDKYYEYLLYLLREMHDGMKTIDELKREVAETRLPEEIKKMFYGVLDTADFASLTEEQQARYES
ncbi:MAG: Rpn family recombination-promoting nuclease/putative transposase, partial [Bacteroidales bacterium]|nr:Rpn family recombination-promoting nuclease/putative transposase [Bacteroidales bacterium]